jgi:valyl-tRNA synthetase
VTDPPLAPSPSCLDSLPNINIFTDDGKINAIGGRFAGLMRFDAREAIEAALKELVRGMTMG